MVNQILNLFKFEQYLTKIYQKNVKKENDVNHIKKEKRKIIIQ